MPTIIAGQDASFDVVIQNNGAAVAVNQSSTVTARLYSADGLTPLSSAVGQTAQPSWAQGVIPVALPSAQTSVAAGHAVLVVTSTSPALAKRFSVVIEAAGAFERSLLLIKDIAVEDLRGDRLMLAGANVMPDVSVSDDYIWSKLVSAEAEVARLLRVPLVPTTFFPSTPTQDQVDALPSGMPWGIDPGYDYSPDMFQGDRWGLIRMRNKPLLSVSKLVFAYPSQQSPQFLFPLEWLRIEKKSGTLQIVPINAAYVATMNTYVLQALSSGRNIPLALLFTYVAGLENVATDWPDIIDLIKKKAVLSIMEDSFLPQSGSISADGLSQSLSVQMDQYHDMIDNKINGPKGSNGGLMTAIHGVRTGFLGG